MQGPRAPDCKEDCLVRAVAVVVAVALVAAGWGLPAAGWLDPLGAARGFPKKPASRHHHMRR